MAEKKNSKRSSRAEERASKASAIVATLPQADPSLTTTSNEIALPVAIEDEQSDPAITSHLVLKEGLRVLRQQLAEKTAQYRESVGKKPSGKSETVSKVLAMLEEGEGATKERLIAKSGAKKGYIDALLSRILPSRGYLITSNFVEGTRAKAYRASRKPIEQIETN